MPKRLTDEQRRYNKLLSTAKWGVSKKYRIPYSLVTQELAECYQLENKAKKSLKLTINGKTFSKNEFCKYVENKYGIPYTTVMQRVMKGCAEIECIIDRSLISRIKQSKTRPIKITDLKTGKIYRFDSINTVTIASRTTVKRCLKNGKPTKKILENSHHPNLLKIEYDEKRTIRRPYTRKNRIKGVDS